MNKMPTKLKHVAAKIIKFLDGVESNENK